jgi:hypothetical protein
VPAQRTALVVAVYVAAYVALDWTSYIHPLGPFAITPWNPPPGLSIALLLTRGLAFAREPARQEPFAVTRPSRGRAQLAARAVARRGFDPRAQSN